MNEEKHQAPINNPVAAGLEAGFRRPSFRRDAPRWFTAVVFGFFFILLLVCLVFIMR